MESPGSTQRRVIDAAPGAVYVSAESFGRFVWGRAANCKKKTLGKKKLNVRVKFPKKVIQGHILDTHQQLTAAHVLNDEAGV